LEKGGRPFSGAALERLLRNIQYLGKVSHQNTVYAGEQAPIIEEGVWKLVNEKLAQERTRASAAAAVMASGNGFRSSPAVARAESVPRITRLLALALKFEKLIESGIVSNYTAVAQVAQVSRSRVTQNGRPVESRT
jgi:hypothetical protein